MMAAGAPDVAEVRRQIVAIYQAHQPRKLPDVDALMAEWAGDEHELLASIRKKWVPAELEPEPEPGPPASRIDGGLLACCSQASTYKCPVRAPNNQPAGRVSDFQ